MKIPTRPAAASPSITVNELMCLAADGDSAAINVLDMIDLNEQNARTATDAELGVWYYASKS